MPAFSTGSHMDLIDVDVTYAAAVVPGAGFSNSLIICDDLAGGTRVAAYANQAAVVADVANLSAAAVAKAAVVFGQTPKPALVLIGNRDTSGTPETWVEALDAILAIRTDFWAIYIESRTDSEIVALAADLMAKEAAKTGYFALFAQSSAADILTTGTPSAYSSATGYTRLIPYYHATAAQHLDAAGGSAVVSWNADIKAPPGNIAVYGVTASGALTAAQKGFAAQNNFNTALPFGTLGTMWVDPGVCIDGTPIDNLLAMDWLLFLLKNRAADLLIALANRGLKLTVDAQGQALMQGNVIDRTLEEGISIGHFQEGQYVVTAETITSSDLSSRLLRFTVYNTVTQSARQVDMDVTSSVSAVVSGS